MPDGEKNSISLQVLSSASRHDHGHLPNMNTEVVNDASHAFSQTRSHC